MHTSTKFETWEPKRNQRELTWDAVWEFLHEAFMMIGKSRFLVKKIKNLSKLVGLLPCFCLIHGQLTEFAGSSEKAFQENPPNWKFSPI